MTEAISEASQDVGEANSSMKISVAMTTYNGARFLSEQLDSILAQTRLPDELVVCDDHSSDCTPRLLNQFAAHSPFPMKIIANDKNLGSTKNFEKAVSLCSGHVIVLCDQDDIWRPQKVAALESAFVADPQLGLVLTNADLIDEHGHALRGDLWSRCRFNRERQQVLGSVRRYDLLFGLPFATGATIAFRSVFKDLVVPFPEHSPTFIHDRWIAVIIAAVSRVGIISEKLIAYRLHGEQQLGVGPPLPLKVFIPHQCRSEAAALAAFEDRLREKELFTHADFWRCLAERRLHIAARSAFSPNPIRRLPQVVNELLTGRYIRYPFGLIFCLKDALVGTR